MGLLLLTILVLVLLAVLPAWDHSRTWGYGPTKVLGALLVIVVILMLLNYIPRGF